MTKNYLIKVLSLISLILYSLLIVMPFWYSQVYSDAVMDFIYYVPEQPIVVFPYWVGWIIYSIFSFCYIMLIAGFSVFRYLFLILVLFDLISVLLSGARGQTGLEYFLLSALSFLDGALFIILFLHSFILPSKKA